MNGTYAVVRRWRKSTATITVHALNCPAAPRAQVAFYVDGLTPAHAEAAAFREVRGEIAIGTSHFGTTCTRCLQEVTA